MARHRNSKPRAVIGTPWFIRLGIYTVVAIVGLVLTVLGFAEPDQVDSWLGQTGSVAALIGGLLAMANTGRGSDEPAEPVVVEAPAANRSFERALSAIESASAALNVHASRGVASTEAPADTSYRADPLGDDLPVYDAPTSGV